jgi:PPOX class probable F420-dependent enzyme
MSDPWTPRQRRLLEGPNIGHLATLLPDGSPHVTPVWIDAEGGIVRVNTAEGRVKHRNVLRDPRVALSITDREDPYEKLLLRGVVEAVSREGARAHIDALSEKYLGRPFPGPLGEPRIILRIRPHRVTR